MNERFYLKSLQVFGTIALVVGLLQAGALAAKGYVPNAFVFLIVAVGGIFVEQYGTTRLVYTLPLEKLLEKAKQYREDSEILSRRVGK